MRHYLHPLGGLILMAILIPKSCAEVTTEFAPPPCDPLPEGSAIFEDWSGDVRSRLEPDSFADQPPGSDGYQSVLNPQEASFGNVLVVERHPDTTGGFDAYSQSIDPLRCFDLSGKQMVVRLDIARAALSYITFQIYATESGDNRFLEVFLAQEEGNPNETEIWYRSGGSDSQFITVPGLEPDGDHAWFRFWSNPGAGNIGIDTAPFCGTWTNRLTSTSELSPSSRIWIQAEGYPEDQPFTRLDTRIGTIYVDDYPETP